MVTLPPPDASATAARLDRPATLSSVALFMRSSPPTEVTPDRPDRSAREAAPEMDRNPPTELRFDRPDRLVNAGFESSSSPPTVVRLDRPSTWVRAGLEGRCRAPPTETRFERPLPQQSEHNACYRTYTPLAWVGGIHC